MRKHCRAIHQHFVSPPDLASIERKTLESETFKTHTHTDVPRWIRPSVIFSVCQHLFAVTDGTEGQTYTHTHRLPAWLSSGVSTCLISMFKRSSALKVDRSVSRLFTHRQWIIVMASHGCHRAIENQLYSSVEVERKEARGHVFGQSTRYIQREAEEVSQCADDTQIENEKEKRNKWWLLMSNRRKEGLYSIRRCSDILVYVTLIPSC